MPFATIKRWLRDSRTPRTPRPMGLTVDRLDDRIVPAASLFDLNNSFLGSANQPSNILGQSDDGRYVIFESKATDLVVGQVDIPGTNDLFWRDLQTGDTRMVTALPQITSTNYDYAATRLAPQSFALQAVVDGAPVLPSFNKAVISGNGLYVGFSTVVNAARLDEDFATSTYAPFSTNTTVMDLANTLDVFRWESKSGNLELASRTVASADTGGATVAFGRYGSSDTPGINSDGTYVGFVSRVDAWYTDSKGKPTAFGAGIIVDAGNTNDVFVTNFDVNAGAQISVMSAGTTSGTADSDPDFIRTYGHAAGGDGVSVDPSGRYLANDIGGALFVVDTAAVNPQLFLGTGYASDIDFSLIRPVGNIRVTTVNAATGGPNQEAFRHDIQAGLIGDITDINITSTGVAGKFGFGNTGITANGGNAQNAIIARNNPNAVVVSASTVGTNNGQFTPFPLAPSALRQDLYYVRTDINSQTVKVLNSQRLPSTISSTTVADTTQYSVSPNGKYLVYTQVEGVQADGVTAKTQVFYRVALPTVGNAQRISVGLDGQPLSTGANSPHVSRNGRFVTFSSTTMANLVVDATITDANNASDAFLRDLFNDVNAAGQFVPRTQLLSVNAAGTATGNGASRNVNVGTLNEDPINGISPSTPEDSVGRAVFNSTATDIDLGFIPLHGGNSSFVQTLPIGGLPPTVPPTDAPRTGVVSGGRDAAIAQITFTGAGTPVLGQRLTPYPGFTGEVRVASADVNGDGVLDTIVAPGPGIGPRVIVFNGTNDQRIADFFGYEATFRGGVNVSAADIDGDGKAEIILGTDKGGGARVRVLSGAQITAQGTGFTSFAVGDGLADFFAYDTVFRGGVRVGTGDFDGDGSMDVLTGAGSGGGPRVSVFSGASIAASGSLNRYIDFFAMELNLRDGVFVAGGDYNNDGIDDILVGAGAGGGPRVRVFESKSVRVRPAAPDLLYDFFTGDINGRAGVRVTAKNVDGDGTTDIVTGNGAGSESRIRTFSGAKLSGPLTPTEIENSFVLFNDLTSLNGAWVG